jgi:hypothetical protein
MEATSPTVIYDKNDRAFKKLEKERVEWLEAFCKMDPCLQTSNGVLKKASTDASDKSIDNAEAAADDDMFILKETAKKTRKLTKELREFTGVSSQGERKHRGWSDEGMVAFEKYLEAIKKDVEDDKYVAWEKAYWGIMEKLGHSKRDNDEP